MSDEAEKKWEPDTEGYTCPDCGHDGSGCDHRIMRSGNDFQCEKCGCSFWITDTPQAA